MSLKEIGREKLLDMYYRMSLIREFELKAQEAFMKGEVPGFIHCYIGEEAVAVGVCANLGHDDYITSTHRGHGHVIAKGADVRKMMAELYGKATGYCKGKGGSLHIIDRDLGILGANGIVGAGIPIATGAGLSAKMRKSKQAVACFFGDGASNQGGFHESLNMASVWKLPVVYVCENNLYALSTSTKQSMSIQDVAVRAKAYGMFGEIADGNDVLDVYEKAKKAFERARNGEGPTLLEAKTYRWTGHYLGDPGLYRTKEEVESWKAKDPIPRFRKALVEGGIAAEKELDDIVASTRAAVVEAAEFARSSPPPDAAGALEDVLA